MVLAESGWPVATLAGRLGDSEVSLTDKVQVPTASENGDILTKFAPCHPLCPSGQDSDMGLPPSAAKRGGAGFQGGAWRTPRQE